MKNNLPLPQDKKLTIVFRVESGCLGPDGAIHIEEFCRFAQKEFETVDADFVHWKIEPRHDKSLAEMQYQVSNKKLNHDQAAKYLGVFNKDLDEFEKHLHNKFALLIDQYLGR